mgnify:CR=1 FL=1
MSLIKKIISFEIGHITERNKAKAEFIIVDETSMVDTYLSGDVKFIFKKLECPKCKVRFSAEEIINAKP